MIPHNSQRRTSSIAYSDDDMDEHFNNLLSDTRSRFTAAQTQISVNNQQAFHSNRMFAMSTLQSWGLKLDNQITLKCLLDLISQKQKDLDYRSKTKEQLNAINFEKEKFESLLKQTKITLAEKDKQLGKFQNELLDLRKKNKLSENQSKKEKADDQKMIMMLKSKNDQLLHEIKKKQAQVLRIKEQMKKSVTSKPSTLIPNNKNESPVHSNSNLVKNSFQLIEKIQKAGMKVGQKWKRNMTQRCERNFLGSLEEQRFNFMQDKYEHQKRNLLNQNSALRGKFYEVREVLVGFAQWIDIQLFGQSQENTKKYLQKKFICNQNIIFSKNALIDDLNQIINEAKNGIQQLQERLQNSEAISIPSLKSIGSPVKNNHNKKTAFNNPSSKSIGSQTNPMFKKKCNSIRQMEAPERPCSMNIKSQQNLDQIKDSNKQIKVPLQQKSLTTGQTQRSLKIFGVNKSPKIIKKPFENEKGFGQFPSQIRKSSKENFINQLQLSAFQNDLLSDIYENSIEDPDHSIVSHISTSELLKEIEKSKSGKYDKWDILFKTEGDEQEQQ